MDMLHLALDNLEQMQSGHDVKKCDLADRDTYRLLAEGGTEEVEVPPERVNARILDDTDLQNLHQLALRCESIYGKDLDIEWGLAGGVLALLQCRSITTSES
jgi:pyruvate,water dikinase